MIPLPQLLLTALQDWCSAAALIPGFTLNCVAATPPFRPHLLLDSSEDFRIPNKRRMVTIVVVISSDASASPAAFVVVAGSGSLPSSSSY